MTNRFKDRTMRACYDNAVSAYNEKRSVLFAGGRPYVGNGMASFFWKGFNGVQMNWEGGSKKITGYAFYRAGQDCAKEART